jgi:predicted Fe-Mo cluster-binding NifX family protein
MMKVAVTTTGASLDDPLSQRFGRAPAFLVVDTETDEVEVVNNTQNLNAMQGAGIQAAQAVAGSGAGAVITGHVGPKAFQVLSAAGVKVYTSDAATVREALEALKTGKLESADTADVQSHW